jgi:hypothetical protein
MDQLVTAFALIGVFVAAVLVLRIAQRHRKP